MDSAVFFFLKIYFDRCYYARVNAYFYTSCERPLSVFKEKKSCYRSKKDCPT